MSIIPSTRKPPVRQPKPVRRGAWASDARLFRDVSWEASGRSSSSSSSLQRSAGAPLAVSSNRPARRGADSSGGKRRRRPLSASYATSNRNAGRQRRQRRPQSARLRPVDDGDAVGVELSAESLHVAREAAPAWSSPGRTRGASQLQRPNSADASIHWLHSLSLASAATRPSSAAARLESSDGAARPKRVWDAYNIYCPRQTIDTEEEKQVEEEEETDPWTDRHHQAATVVQCAYRRRLAVREAGARRVAKKRDLGATVIQAYSRGWLWRLRLLGIRDAVQHIQRIFRGYLGRRVALEAAAQRAAELAAIVYVPPPWGVKETEVLMMLCERDGCSSWARKALQLGGRRKAQDLQARYFWVLRQQKEEEEAEEAAAEAVREAAAAEEAEARAEQHRIRAAEKAERKRVAAAKRFGAGGVGQGRKAVWAVGDTHNASVAYKLDEEAKREAEEGAILEVLLRMLQGEKTLFGQKMGSADSAFKILVREHHKRPLLHLFGRDPERRVACGRTRTALVSWTCRNLLKA